MVGNPDDTERTNSPMQLDGLKVAVLVTDGYEASERILNMSWDPSPSEPSDLDVKNEGHGGNAKVPTILAVTADVTDGALEKAATVGMKGFLTKPFKVMDLERLILEYCATLHSKEDLSLV